MTTTDNKGNNGLSGGIMKRQMPEHRVTNYIDVKSVEEYSSKVKKHGGKIVASKKAVPGMGYFALCLDTENNAFAIWEVDDMLDNCFFSYFGTDDNLLVNFHTSTSN
ncbi:MAG: hypothetical protein WA395_10300 [Nitrososphaeraceae archaeon]